MKWHLKINDTRVEFLSSFLLRIKSDGGSWCTMLLTYVFVFGCAVVLKKWFRYICTWFLCVHLL